MMNKKLLINLFSMSTKAVFLLSTILTLLLYSACSSDDPTETPVTTQQTPENTQAGQQNPENTQSGQQNPENTQAGQQNPENTATTQQQTYTVTFINRGSEVAQESVSGGSVVDKFTNLSPPSKGLFLRGWFKDNETSNDEYNFSAPVTQSLTLHAKWEYMVTYTGGVITGLNSALRDSQNIRLFIPANINGVAMETIQNGAFEDNKRITSLEISEGIRLIGQNAFLKCSGFTGDLTIPNSVETIGENAFWGCSNFNGSLIIGNSVVTIGRSAFANCLNFKGDLMIPNSVRTIGKSAFNRCFGFSGSLTIANSVVTIEKGAFSGCSGFTGSLTIGNSVETIGDEAFINCSNFDGNLTIPSSVDTIGTLAFSAMGGIDAFIFVSNSPPDTIGLAVFPARLPSDLDIRVPAEAVERYKAVSNLSQYSESIKAR